jgi:hypothetical protein
MLQGGYFRGRLAARAAGLVALVRSRWPQGVFIRPRGGRVPEDRSGRCALDCVSIVDEQSFLFSIR